ncbi:MAG: LysR family transcriptional regulator [Pseudorhodoplanes sp.]|jgi:predicted thioesterase|nr:LysR family transcriptional regulator [Pseudorhodoplanes sp.]
MKESLRAGVSESRRFVVDKDRTIGFMGEEGRVYATPSLVRDIEQTCRDFLIAHADPNEDSVGMEVSVRHQAPTLPGMTVEITVTVAAVEGRKVTFDVVARDDVEPIADGRHTRFVVDVSKTLERLKAKAARHAAATVA